MGRMGASPSIFRIADHALVRCEDGALEIEATLFPGPPGAIATTSASKARSRLGWSGLTPALAKQAFEAIDPVALASYACADGAGAVLSKLGPCEAFAGRTYDPRSQTYDGVWLDLRALAADLNVQSAGFVLQGLFLVSMLDELTPNAKITLEHGGSGKAARVAFLKPNSVIAALSRLGPRSQRHRGDRLSRSELARRVRDQSSAVHRAGRARCHAIEQALAEIDKPARGRLAEIELWMIERQLAGSDARGALERIESYVRSYDGETPATHYLRAHLALVEGSEPWKHIADASPDAEGRSGEPFYELDLLKARAWMAAGAWAHARHFARKIVDDPNVSDDMSLAAHEIVELADSHGAARGHDEAPPSTERVPVHSGHLNTTATGYYSKASEEITRSITLEMTRPSVLGVPIVVVEGSPMEQAPASIEVVVDLEEPISAPPAMMSSTLAVVERPAEIIFASAFVEPNVPLDRGHETDRPPPMRAMLAPVARAPRRYAYIPEDVESLALPGGLSDAQLAEGMAARNGDEVRIVSTRFARVLGREYREKYGVQLRTDAHAVEWMQRHLISRWGSTGLTGPAATWDVRRHGALLSEILARTLDAEWVDVAPTEIGYWAMFVPPRTRTWPFGRVHRFLSLGHREKDLVSYYLDLVGRSRGG